MEEKVGRWIGELQGGVSGSVGCVAMSGGVSGGEVVELSGGNGGGSGCDVGDGGSGSWGSDVNR